MALIQEQYIQLIITSIGGDTADQLLATNLPIFWEGRASVEDLSARAQLVKLDAIDLLLGQMWRKVSFRALDGADVKLSDMFEHLVKLRTIAQAAADSGTIGSDAGGAAGELTATAPIAPPSIWSPDANDQAYRGSPYRTRRSRGGL